MSFRRRVFPLKPVGVATGRSPVMKPAPAKALSGRFLLSGFFQIALHHRVCRRPEKSRQWSRHCAAPLKRLRISHQLSPHRVGSDLAEDFSTGALLQGQGIPFSCRHRRVTVRRKFGQDRKRWVLSFNFSHGTPGRSMIPLAGWFLASAGFLAP